MKVRSSLQFYGDQRGTLVMFNGTGTTDGVDTEVFREIQLENLTMQDTFDGSQALMSLFASGRRYDMYLSKVENQATWTNNQAGLDNCYATITTWKAEYAAFLAQDPRLPNAVNGKVLTGVNNAWSAEDPSGGSIAPVQTTYADLMALIGESGLSKGTLYEFEHTPRYYGASTEDAPAPGNITLTPDAVGDNPVTYYYKAVYLNGATSRSVVSDEFTCEQGDSTTELIYDCDELPEWADGVWIIRGAETGVYTDLIPIPLTELPSDVYGTFITDPDGYIAGMELLPIEQLPTTGAVSGTPETILALATSESTIDCVVKSVEHPYDICQYDWNGDNWLTDGRYAQDGTIITDWTGVIYKRTGKRFDPKVYKALISQSNVEQTSGTLTEGKVYYISDYKAGDDFTNVGAASNETGVTFTATGDTPTVYSNGSTLVDVAASAPVETVLEDTTGVATTFEWDTEGYYWWLVKTDIFTENKTIPTEQTPYTGFAFSLEHPSRILLYKTQLGEEEYSEFEGTISIEIYP